jgi:UDP-2-acetamido-3-amino-2,3-dideoxy-glucuronate N-acetyltransferase
VEAHGSAFLQPGIHDITTVRLAFPSGVKAIISSSWLRPQKERRMVVVGDRAMAVFDDMKPWAEKLILHHNAIHWDRGRPRAVAGPSEAVIVPEGEPLRHEMQHFIDSIEGGTVPKSDAREAIRVLRVLRAAQAELEKHV